MFILEMAAPTTLKNIRIHQDRILPIEAPSHPAYTKNQPEHTENQPGKQAPSHHTTFTHQRTLTCSGQRYAKVARIDKCRGANPPASLQCKPAAHEVHH